MIGWLFTLSQCILCEQLKFMTQIMVMKAIRKTIHNSCFMVHFPSSCFLYPEIILALSHSLFLAAVSVSFCKFSWWFFLIELSAGLIIWCGVSLRSYAKFCHSKFINHNLKCLNRLPFIFMMIMWQITIDLMFVNWSKLSICSRGAFLQYIFFCFKIDVF